MKQGSNPKRSRGRGSARRDGGSYRGHSIESNGPEVRIRGTVSQVLEKYLALARDASSSGDIVSAENYLQHAEHYYRVMNGNGGASSGGQKPRGHGRSRGNGVQGGPQAEPRQPGDGADAAPEAPAGAKPGAPSSDPDSPGPSQSSS